MLYAGEKAADVAPCDECVAQRGLCGRHKRAILPQLAQPHWYRLVGTDHHDERTEMSREARKVADRKARKAKRRAELLALAAELPLRTPSDIRRDARLPILTA